MKKVAVILLSLAALAPARAQWLHPEAVEGALLGTFIGGIAGGNHCHEFSGQGAAIGAGVGLIAGSILGESRRHDYYETPGYVYPTSPSVNVSFGYGYGSCGSSAYVYYTPNRYCAPGTYYRPTRPNYVVSGTVLGAASGALIGSANHNAGQGAAIGAAAGLMLGGVAELGARKEEQSFVPQTTVTPEQTHSQTASAQPATPQPGVTSTPCPTSTYTWAVRPQIANAPSVPDAPTF